MTTVVPTESSPAFTTSGYSYTPPEPSAPDAIAYPNSGAYNTSPDASNGWPYPHTGQAPHTVQPHPLRNAPRGHIPPPTTGDPWNSQSAYRADAESTTFRTWPAAEPSYQTPVPSQATVYNNHDVDQSNRTYHPTAQPDGREYHQWNQPQQDSYAANYDLYGTPSYPQQSPQTPYPQANYTQSNPSSSSSPHPASPPLPRHIYTRTLVGPLSSNACRLLDEHQSPGIFFLFQDLSVRTEGSHNFITRLVSLLLTRLKLYSRDLSTSLTANECWRVRKFTCWVTQGCVIDCLILILAHPLLRPAQRAFTQIYPPFWPRPSRILLLFSLPSGSQEYPVCKPESIRRPDSHCYPRKKPLPSQLHLAIKAKSFHW